MQSGENPFEQDVLEKLTDVSDFHITSVHAEEAERLLFLLGEAAKGSSGKTILLTSPRAGFGKTHLLSFVSSDVAQDKILLNPEFPENTPITWGSLYSQLLSEMHTKNGAKRGTTSLDDFARGLFANLIHQLILSEKIPTSDRSLTLKALSERPLDVFHFEESTQPVAIWFTGNFEQLRPVLAEPLVESSDLDQRSAEAWLDALYSYTKDSAPSDPDIRIKSLDRLLNGEKSVESEHSIRKQFENFVQIAGQGRSIVAFFDHLDGFFQDTDRARALAHILTAIQSGGGGLIPVLSVNQDVWDSSFGAAIPSAVSDRLSCRIIELPEIDLSEAESLVEARLEESNLNRDTTTRFASFLNLQRLIGDDDSGQSLSPRRVLRYAASQWDEFCAGETIELSPATSADSSERNTNEDEEGSSTAFRSPFSSEKYPNDEEEEEPTTGTELPEDLPVAQSLPPKRETKPETEPEPPLDPEARTLFEPLEEASETSPFAAPEEEKPTPGTSSASPAAAASIFTPLEEPPTKVEPPEVEQSAPANEPDDAPTSEPIAPASEPITPTSEAAPEKEPDFDFGFRSNVGSSELPKFRGTPGDEAPFEKLKEMLSRLRSDEDGESDEDPSPPPESLATRESESLGKLEAPSLDTAKAVGEPTENKTADQRIILERYNELKASQECETAWPRQICDLLHAGAKVHQGSNLEEFRLPEANGRTASKWKVGDQEILFSGESLEDLDYWKVLTAFTSRRSSVRHELTSESSSFPNVKLIIIVPDSGHAQLEALQQLATTAPIDLFLPSEEEQNQINTLCRLAKDFPATSPQDIIVATAPVLQPLWQRILKPL